MEAALDDIASGELDSTPYLRAFFLGKDGIEARVASGLETIDARAISTIEAKKWEPYRVRVGRFGPYVEGEIDNDTVTASLPDNLPPADLTRENIESLLLSGKNGDSTVGQDPATGQPILLRSGPYGPYLQLGEEAESKKPKRSSLPPGLKQQDVTESIAVELISLPKKIGVHPESGVPVEIGIGRYGPYVRHGRTYASLQKGDSLFETSFDRAMTLLTKKETRNKPLRVLGDHPKTGESIRVLDGRYGPYVKHTTTNATLPKGVTPETVTLEQGLALLAEKEAKKPSTPSGRSAGKKGRAKPTKPKNSRPKATWTELSQHLAELDKNVADVVVKIEGMNGSPSTDVKAVATATSLSEEEVAALHKRGMFKLRMAFGKARAQSEGNP
jgi:DNA topoisomerase-1